MRIHVTDIKDYKTCARKFKYSSVWNLEARAKPRSLAFGTAMHEFLASWYAWNDFSHAMACGLAKTDGLDESEVELIEKLASAYVEWEEANGKLRPYSDWIEKEFEVSVGDKTVCGKLDMISEDEYGNLWIVDHKTAKLFPDEEALRLDIQMAYYAVLIRQVVGDRVKGVLYNAIRKQEPNKARVDVFRRFRLVRSGAEMSNIAKDLELTLNRIAKDNEYLISPGLQCKACQYKELCLAELEDRNVQSVVDMLYQERDREGCYDDNQHQDC